MVQNVSPAYSAPLSQQLKAWESSLGEETKEDPELALVDFIRGQQEYNPFKEDVYSLGLIIFQMMLMCGQREVQDLRKSRDQLRQTVLSKFKP